MKNFLRIFTLTLVSLILIGGQQLVVSGVAQAQTKASTTVCFDKKTGAVAASNDKKECADASFKATTIDAYDNPACLTGTYLCTQGEARPAAGTACSAKRCLAYINQTLR